MLLWIEQSGYNRPSGTFYDVGHGAGKGLIAAAICGNFSKIKGVELLDGLYYVSLRLKDTYTKSLTTVSTVEI